MWHLFKQVGRIYKFIKHEHEWLLKLASKRKIDWIISDNRYGLWHPQIPCTFITHQLRVKIPNDLAFAENLVQSFIYSHINRFTQCWVPDEPFGPYQLSGGLGHPTKLPNIKVTYIGWQSRFLFKPAKETFGYRCIVLLSGPEPQRSILEALICESVQEISFDMILVRGLPGNAEPLLKVSEKVKVYNHLPTHKLEVAMAESEFLVARSGYSTLMDAFTLQKKCILIPTPGQTEQEYLGAQLHNKRAALVYTQQQFNLLQALEAAKYYPFKIPQPSPIDLLDAAIADSREVRELRDVRE